MNLYLANPEKTNEFNRDVYGVTQREKVTVHTVSYLIVSVLKVSLIIG